MSQRDSSPVARERMDHGLCPECGGPVALHSSDLRFWMPRSCDLTPDGVNDRIRQHRSDMQDATPGKGRDAHEDHHTSTVAAAAAAERRRAWAEQDYPIDRPDPSEW